MPLRIGFDMDGVLADFGAAYHAIEERLFGPASPTTRAGDPEEEAQIEEEAPGQDAATAGATSPVSEDRRDPARSERRDRERRADAAREHGGRRSMLRRHRDKVWQDIHGTPDFWMTLKETEDGAVRRVHELMLRHRWEVFFITQRPATDGDTVQRQTQRWLVAHGFDLPSVLVVPGSRGAAAAALTLDYHVDDSPKNCIDVRSESRARALLIVPPDDQRSADSVHRLGIGTASTITAALDILDQATLAHTQPTLLARIAKMVGWA